MTSNKHGKHCWQPNKIVKFWSSSNKTISAGTSNLKVFIVNFLWQYKALASTYLSIGKILSIDTSFYIAPDSRQPDQRVKLIWVPSYLFLLTLGDSVLLLRNQSLSISREEAKIPFSYEDTLRTFSKLQAVVLKAASQAFPTPEIFDKNPYIEKLYDMRILASHPDYRGKGIATQLIIQSVQVS